MTIVEAIKQVMRERGAPMTVAEVYGAIIDQGLYTFNADQPEQIVRQQIRRHCIANLMMEKQFGVEVETLPIFSAALDNAMSDGAEPPNG